MANRTTDIGDWRVTEYSYEPGAGSRPRYAEATRERRGRREWCMVEYDGVDFEIDYDALYDGHNTFDVPGEVIVALIAIHARRSTGCGPDWDWEDSAD